MLREQCRSPDFGRRPAGTRWDGELANWPAAPDCDGVAVVEVAEFRGHDPVGKMSERKAPVRRSIREAPTPAPHVGAGHLEIFRLSTSITAEKMRVTEQAGG